MTESTVRPILALTMGDPVGIGPEIIVKALVDARIYQVCRPLVIGDLSALERARLALDPALKIHVADRPAAGHYQQGTLDLMVLKTLEAMGAQHGYGIARRIEQVSRDVLRLNEGTVYTSLLRLQQQGWIVSTWGVSENNRKAKFYSITRRGRKQLVSETENWERIAGVIARLLQLAPGGDA